MKAAPELIYRRPRSQDIDDLLDIEQHAFSSDRLSRRRMRHWIHAKNCTFKVCEDYSNHNIAGYILFFYRSNNRTARLYSIAVSEKYRGHGIARQLMNLGEQQVREDDKNHIQLEVRPDNNAAITLYQMLGYQSFGHYPEFYEDGTDALRFEKNLV